MDGEHAAVMHVRPSGNPAVQDHHDAGEVGKLGGDASVELGPFAGDDVEELCLALVTAWELERQACAHSASLSISRAVGLIPVDTSRRTLAFLLDLGPMRTLRRMRWSWEPADLERVTCRRPVDICKHMNYIRGQRYIRWPTKR